MYFFVFAHSLSKDSNGFNPFTDTLPHVPHVSQAIVRVDSGPGPKCAPKSKGCKPCVNLVQTKLLGLHGERFSVNVKGSM